MPRRSRPNYYAVAVGRRPGVYTHWDACRNEVEGFSGAKYKGFNDLESAHRYVEQESYYAHPQPTYPVYTSAAAAVPEDELIEVQPRRELLPSARHQDAVQIVYVDGSAPSNGQFGAVAGIGIVWGDLSTCVQPMTVCSLCIALICSSGTRRHYQGTFKRIIELNFT